MTPEWQLIETLRDVAEKHKARAEAAEQQLQALQQAYERAAHGLKVAMTDLQRVQRWTDAQVFARAAEQALWEAERLAQPGAAGQESK